MRFILMSLLLAAPALAQSTPPLAEPPPVKKLDRPKCRKEMPIGSLVPKRVCTTERIENLNRDEARATFVRPQLMEPQ
jgi:hypothetical protein